MKKHRFVGFPTITSRQNRPEHRGTQEDCNSCLFRGVPHCCRSYINFRFVVTDDTNIEWTLQTGVESSVIDGSNDTTNTYRPPYLKKKKHSHGQQRQQRDKSRQEQKNNTG